MFDACLRAVERSLVHPLAGPVAISNAIACLSRFADDHRRAMAEGGELRRAAQQGAVRLQRQITGTALPALAKLFEDTESSPSLTAAGPDGSEPVSAVEAATLLAAIASWQHASGSGTEAGALAARVGAALAQQAKRRVDRFKAQQSPEDAPDYRAVAADLAFLDETIRVARHLNRPQSAAEIGRLRDHYGRVALISALAVIQRGTDNADMFVHFDIAAMLVSVEHVVVVISRTLDAVEEERAHAHPHVETVSEPVVRDFASGLMRLAPNYVRMLKNTVSGVGKAVPEFGFSVLRVLLQITRLIRILHYHLHDGRLADAANKIAADVAELRGKLLITASDDPDLAARIISALEALSADPIPGAADGRDAAG
ncbi:hypothetical protein T8K17_00535 [Thalassobaculum sp. OXR-137]|uniref:hypothetical protein n=1 Tax=Thalassobaculum sp. OXR-137 TaxID=3100173 RepID=UPI002AC9EA46|nr:hypothetical protein [Thalassobaculum sp. OXR-137]WPZ34634.1 hypothetical protein T8K17_00535 [Thalassobaculum sp. OXR-137]